MSVEARLRNIQDMSRLLVIAVSTLKKEVGTEVTKAMLKNQIDTLNN